MGVKTWLSSQAAYLLYTGIQIFIPRTTSASVLAVTMLRNSLSMYLLFVYNKILKLKTLLNEGTNKMKSKGNISA
jgi:hypothetical protein